MVVAVACAGGWRRPVHSGLVVWLAAGFGVPMGVAALVFKLDQHAHPLPDIAVNWLSAVLYLAAGVLVQLRRPGNPVGLLMVLASVALFSEDLQLSTTAWIHSVGMFCAKASIGVLAHLVLAFPDGRLVTRVQRRLVGAAYAGAFGLVPAAALFSQTRRLEAPRTNLFLVADWPRVATVFGWSVKVVGAAVAVGVLAVLVSQWRSASRPLQRVLAPVYLAGLLGGAATAAGLFGDVGGAWRLSVLVASWAALLLLPLGFLVGVLRTRLGRTRISVLLSRLREPISTAQLQAELARALGDPSLRVGRWRPATETFVDDDGRALDVPAHGSARGVRLIERNGAPTAVLLHDPALVEDAHVLEAAITAAALSLENQRLEAESHATSTAARASLRQAITAQDTARRRLEQDLHDGVQSQLVTVATWLRLARDQLGPTVDDADGAQLLTLCAQGLEAALSDLRSLASGIHPAVLSDGGVAPALRALAARLPLPIDLCLGDLPRLGPAEEATGYYVAAEALTNVLKHAQATRVVITVSYTDGQLSVAVVDNGVGGARIGAGSGLLNLRDRVSAMDGDLTVHSLPGTGTSLTATFACQPRASGEGTSR